MRRTRQFPLIVLLALVVVLAATAEKTSPPQEDCCEVLPYANAKQEPSPYRFDVRGGAICHYKVHNDLPLHHFKLIANPKLNTIASVEISKGNPKESIQTLTLPELDEGPFNAKEMFTLVDMNFDGYKDIRMMAWSGAMGANMGYLFWLFDPATGKFVQNDELSALSSATPDPKTKTISTHWRMGLDLYVDTFHQFDKSGKLIMIKSISRDRPTPEAHAIRIVEELIDGKMVITSTIDNDDDRTSFP